MVTILPRFVWRLAAVMEKEGESNKGNISQIHVTGKKGRLEAPASYGRTDRLRKKDGLVRSATSICSGRRGQIIERRTIRRTTGGTPRPTSPYTVSLSLCGAVPLCPRFQWAGRARAPLSFGSSAKRYIVCNSIDE